jgi:hypothetical protein
MIKHLPSYNIVYIHSQITAVGYIIDCLNDAWLLLLLLLPTSPRVARAARGPLKTRGLKHLLHFAPFNLCQSDCNSEIFEKSSLY